MRNRKERIVLAVAAFIMGGCASIGVSAINVSAETALTYNTFKMQNGASVRIGSVADEESGRIVDGGLRFSADISKSEYDALIGAGSKFGFIIAASDKLGSLELDEKNVFTDPQVYYAGQENPDTTKIMVTNVRAEYANVDDDSEYELCGALTSIKESNLTRAFIGRAYVAIPTATETVENANGETETVVTSWEYHFAPYYADDGNIADDVKNNTRSMYYVAQKAVEAKDVNSDTLNEDYISKLSNRPYKCIINYHYTALDGTKTTVSTKVDKIENGDNTVEVLLNQEVEIAVENQVEYNGKKYELSETANADQPRSGLVYATLLQTFDVFYNQIAEEGEVNVQAKLESMLTAANASDYFDGTMEYVDNELSATDDNSGLGFFTTGRESVTFNKDFLSELYDSGVRTLRVKTIYATMEILGGMAQVPSECVVVKGYNTEYHFSNREDDITDTSTQKLVGTMTTVENKTYLTAGADGYIYFDIRYVSEIQFVSYRTALWGNETHSEVAVDWVMDDFTVLTESVDDLQGEGLIIIK